MLMNIHLVAACTLYTETGPFELLSYVTYHGILAVIICSCHLWVIALTQCVDRVQREIYQSAYVSNHGISALITFFVIIG